MSDAISAQGTILAVSPDPTWPPSAPIGGAVAFTDIAELGDTTPPARTRKEIETTTHNQQDDRYIMGIRRASDVTVNINWIPTDPTHSASTGLLKKIDDGTRNIYRITYPDGTQWLFSGFVKNVGPEAKVDDKLTAQVVIRPTGRQAWSA